MKYIFDSLLEPDENGYIPWLAESWEISDDYTTYVFNIRRGVKWHDGNELDAHDVAFSFNYYQEYAPVFTSDRISNKDYLLSIKALSDYQVEFVTAGPDATFMNEVGMMRIIPEHIWKDVDNPHEFVDEEATIGCGPYMLTDYSKEHKTYRYVAFEEYWGPKQRVDVIEFVPVSDSVLALENGDIDIARITSDVRDRFGDQGFTLVESPAFSGVMLTFNMHENELFQNKAFRQAIAHAINKADFVTKLARGLAKPGSPGILPIDHQYYNPGIVDYEYDPAKAIELLQEAGIEQDISIELLVDDGSGVRIAEILKEQLSDVGINLDVVSVDSKSRDARVFDGDYEMAVIGMGSWGLDADWIRVRYHSQIDYEDAGGSLSALLGADQGYQNTELDKLLVEQRAEVDPEKRNLLLFEIQEILAQDVPEIPLYNSYYLYAYNADKYDGWTFMFDHPVMEHAKLSYLQR